MSASDKEDLAWLERIMADSENLDLRLEFAGWLEGRGEAAVAELIRLQCNATKKYGPKSRGMDSNERIVHHGQLTRLISQHALLDYFGMANNLEGVAHIDNIDNEKCYFKNSGLHSVSFCHGLPTQASLGCSGDIQHVPAILKEVLVTEVVADFGRVRSWQDISHMKAMKKLFVCHCSNYDNMPVFENLEAMSIVLTRSGFNGFDQLTAQPKLRTLDISCDSGVSPASLNGMHTFPELEELALPVSVRVLQGMPLLPKLKKISVGMRHTMDVKEELAQQPALETLKINPQSKVADLENIHLIVPKLQGLDLSGLKYLCSIRHMSQLNELKQLDITDTYLDDEQLKRIPDSIRELKLPFNQIEAAKRLLEQGRWPNLRNINGLDRTYYIDGDAPTAAQEAPPVPVEEAAPKEKQSFSAEIEHLADVSERLKKFKRPEGLGRSL